MQRQFFYNTPKPSLQYDFSATTVFRLCEYAATTVPRQLCNKSFAVATQKSCNSSGSSSSSSGSSSALVL
jgi:hypothetical protein